MSDTEHEDCDPEAQIVEMHLDQSGFNFKVQHPVVPLLATYLADAFRDAKGINFVSFDIDHPEIGPLQLVMQRRLGATPANLAHRYREALERIRDSGNQSESTKIAITALATP